MKLLKLKSPVLRRGSMMALSCLYISIGDGGSTDDVGKGHAPDWYRVNLGGTGMLPMVSGAGESGDQSAPLGRAVIGGLFASTFAALLIVPLVYGWVKQGYRFGSV